MKTLHILNGDDTFWKFKDSSLTGDVLVWREVLSEGPVDCNLPYPEFFRTRSKWIAAAFTVSEADYLEKVAGEFEKLQAASAYDEIVLWFEFDLHCQINLLFLLNYFSTINLRKTTLSLICPSSHPNHADFRGIGQLKPNELANLFPSRVKLNGATLEFAAEAWRIYCSQNKQLIEQVLRRHFGQLALLKPALEAHLDRMREPGLPITPFEQKLISIVKLHPTSRKEVYKEFWANSTIYGMGDREIDLYLDSLTKQNLIPFIPSV